VPGLDFEGSGNKIPIVVGSPAFRSVHENLDLKVRAECRTKVGEVDYSKIFSGFLSLRVLARDAQEAQQKLLVNQFAAAVDMISLDSAPVQFVLKSGAAKDRLEEIAVSLVETLILQVLEKVKVADVSGGVGSCKSPMLAMLREFLVQAVAKAKQQAFLAHKMHDDLSMMHTILKVSSKCAVEPPEVKAALEYLNEDLGCFLDGIGFLKAVWLEFFGLVLRGSLADTNPWSGQIGTRSQTKTFGTPCLGARPIFSQNIFARCPLPPALKAIWLEAFDQIFIGTSSENWAAC